METALNECVFTAVGFSAGISIAAIVQGLLAAIVSCSVIAAPVPPPLDPVASTSCPDVPEIAFHCWISGTNGAVELVLAVTVAGGFREPMAATSIRPSFAPAVMAPENAISAVP